MRGQVFRWIQEENEKIERQSKKSRSPHTPAVRQLGISSCFIFFCDVTRLIRRRNISCKKERNSSRFQWLYSNHYSSVEQFLVQFHLAQWERKKRDSKQTKLRTLKSTWNASPAVNYVCLRNWRLSVATCIYQCQKDNNKNNKRNSK